MKKILFICILFFNIQVASASEIIGHISTNPSDYQSGQTDENPETRDNNISADEISEQEAGAPIIFPKKIVLVEDQDNATGKEQDIKVLGISHYPDNTLVRGVDNKIYIIQGQTKKHIINLGELQKYCSQPIYTMQDSELAKYQNRQFLNGQLIREKGTEKVFVIKNSQKKYVINLEELRVNYFGMKIHNIVPEEMALYEDYKS